MPTYNYRCAACGFEFERVQRMSEDPIKECPNCGKAEASRQITQGNFILKGGGWYGDLYSGSSNKKGSLSTSAEGASTSASPSAPAAPAAPSTAAPASTGSSGGSSGSST